MNAYDLAANAARTHPMACPEESRRGFYAAHGAYPSADRPGYVEVYRDGAWRWVPEWQHGLSDAAVARIKAERAAARAALGDDDSALPF